MPAISLSAARRWWIYQRERFPVLAHGPLGAQAFRVGDRAWGLQFHLEVDDRIVNHWLDLAPHEADAAGESVEELRARTAAEASGSTARALAVGRRFAQVVG